MMKPESMGATAPEHFSDEDDISLAESKSSADDEVSVSTALKSMRSATESVEALSKAETEESTTDAETRAVVRSKRLMLVLLALAAVGAAVLTYYFVREAEVDSFNKSFERNVYELQEDLVQKWHSSQVAIENLAISVTSAAVAAQELAELASFQMPFFGEHGQDVVELTSEAALVVGWGPLVPTEDAEGATVMELPITHLYPRGLPVKEFNLLADTQLNAAFLEMVVTSQPLQTGLDRPTFVDLHEPATMFLQPIFSGTVDEEKDALVVVGVSFSLLSWTNLFTGILPFGSGKTIVAIQDTCDTMQLIYEVDGHNATLMPPSTLDEMSDAMIGMQQDIWLHSLSTSNSTCEYKLHVYPTETYEDMYLTNKPWLYSAVVFAVVGMFLAAFVCYDKFVQHRQERVLAKAARSNAIVASLFPSNVRDRILQQAENDVDNKNSKNAKKLYPSSGKNQLKSFLDEEGPTSSNKKGDDDDSRPIADLFPHTTVMFADIAGFTAWSSIREPCQVFELLETLYNAFDEIASRRRVFKVETIGDCYVAVCGLPEPRKEHATTMVRFARDLLVMMSKLTRRLENTLGPDTGDLSLRIGLHSGPVTAGVLRSTNCRFQLFGDTVNTAARMESNGKRDAIHISEETANLIRDAGKEEWLIEREDKIVAKGKGQLNTYFVTVKKPAGAAASTTNSGSSVGTAEKSDTLDGFSMSTAGSGLSARLKRLVTFNADLVGRLLKAVVARRDAERSLNKGIRTGTVVAPTLAKKNSMHGGTVIDEVKDILTLPKFNAKAAMKQQDPKDVILNDLVIKQIHEYVTVLATMYRNKDVPFHNFEHASHVTMSVSKLLSRIVAPDTLLTFENGNEDAVVKDLHEHTYGITSDPMTQFAAVIAALIHDVDHTGVPNAQLIKEGTRLAEAYKNKSVAEQNSVDLAWDLLMDDQFKDLRATIVTNEAEEKHFRSLLVNLVIATDICDKDLGAQRKARWAKAFSGATEVGESEDEATNRKATIVLEHLIQASDVAHTMQHWHIYRKWNEKFFEENMKAFRAGRSEGNPANFWYEGELGFFDFYIIPLAKKLKECGVFGVASDEYLDYATKNRKEWELHGKQAVAEMSAKYLDVLTEEDEELSVGEGGDDASESAGSFDSSSALIIDGNIIFNVGECWEQLRRIPGYEEKAGTILFSVLFVKCPPAKVLFGFPIGMDPKSTQLTTSKRFLTHAKYMIQMLDKALALLGPDSEALAEILAELGKKHVRLGVKEDFFPIMGEALITTLQEMLGDKINSEMVDSWKVVYNALSSEMIRSMNTDKAVVYSWNKLKAMENYQEVAGVILFRKLFELCPESKALFGFQVDMDIDSDKMLQSRRFKTHAAYFIEMLDKALSMVENKEIGSAMKRLGEMHVQYGVKEEYFELMGEALFHTLEQVLVKTWTIQVEEAWHDVYGRLASGMIKAMQEAQEPSK